MYKEKYIEIPVSSSTVTLKSADLSKRYVLTGTPTLTTNFALTVDTAIEGQSVEVVYKATATLSGNSIVIFGTTIPSEYAGKKWIAKCNYNLSGWTVTLIVSSNQTDIVSSSQIVNNAITSDKILNDAVTTSKILNANVTLDKLANLTRGSILIGNSSNRPIELTKGTAGQVLVSDGADLSWGTASFTSTLQGAYNGGNTIVIASGVSLPVQITTNSATTEALKVISTTASNASRFYTSATARNIYIDGANNTEADGENIYSVYNIGELTESAYGHYFGAEHKAAQTAYVFDNLYAKLTDIASNSTSHISNGITSDVVFITSSQAKLRNFFAKTSGTQGAAGSFCYLYNGEADHVMSDAGAYFVGVNIDAGGMTSTDGDFTYARFYNLYSGAAFLTHNSFRGVHINHKYDLVSGGTAKGIEINLENSITGIDNGNVYGIKTSQDVQEADTAGTNHYGLHQTITILDTPSSVYGRWLHMYNTTASTSNKNMYADYQVITYLLNNASMEAYGLYMDSSASVNTLSAEFDGIHIKGSGTAGRGFSKGLVLENIRNVGVEIKTTTNLATSTIGIEMALVNAGAGVEAAFKFGGDEIVGSAVGGSQDKKIRVLTGGTVYYIPLHTE